MLTNEQINIYRNKSVRELKRLERRGELTRDDIDQIYATIPDVCAFAVSSERAKICIYTSFEYDNMYLLAAAARDVAAILNDNGIHIDRNELAEQFFLNQRFGDNICVD